MKKNKGGNKTGFKKSEISNYCHPLEKERKEGGVDVCALGSMLSLGMEQGGQLQRTKNGAETGRGVGMREKIREIRQ